MPTPIKTNKKSLEDDFFEEVEVETSPEVNKTISYVPHSKPVNNYVPAPIVLGHTLKDKISGKEPWVENYDSPIKPTDTTMSAYKQYVEGPVFEARAKAMYSPEDAERFIRTTRASLALDRYKINPTVSDNPSARIANNASFGTVKGGIITGGRTSYLNSPSVLSHEIGHVTYPSADYYNHINYNNVPALNPNVSQSTAKNIYPKTSTADIKNGATYYRDPITDSVMSGTLTHDRDKTEQIPFVYETREDMRTQGLWDYTTGQPLTKEIYEQYLKSKPNSRLGNYYDIDTGVKLLNTIALNKKASLKNRNNTTV